MNILDLFMLILFIFGILLIFITFSIYTNLTDECTNSSYLRLKLRVIIGLGTTFTTIAIGYVFYKNRSSCKCDLPKNSMELLYILLVAIIMISTILLTLIVQIKDGLNTCVNTTDTTNVSSNILIGLSITGIVVPVIIFLYLLKKYKTS